MEQDQELGGGIGVIFVPAKSFIRSPVSIPTPGRRWTSSDRNGRNLGTGPTDASCLRREPTPSSRRRRPFRLMDQSQAEEKPWIKWEHHGRGSVPVRTLITSLTSKTC